MKRRKKIGKLKNLSEKEFFSGELFNGIIMVYFLYRKLSKEFSTFNLIFLEEYLKRKKKRSRLQLEINQ